MPSPHRFTTKLATSEFIRESCSVRLSHGDRENLKHGDIEGRERPVEAQGNQRAVFYHDTQRGVLRQIRTATSTQTAQYPIILKPKKAELSGKGKRKSTEEPPVLQSCAREQILSGSCYSL